MHPTRCRRFRSWSFATFRQFAVAAKPETTHRFTASERNPSSAYRRTPVRNRFDKRQRLFDDLQRVSKLHRFVPVIGHQTKVVRPIEHAPPFEDRKSTRLNSSH